MKWGALSSIFLIASTKSMIAPLPGPKLGLSFIETYIATTSGAILGVAVFYFAAEYFMLRTKKKRDKKRQIALSKGLRFKEKKKFTRINRLIVRIKRSLGIIGLAFWAPFFMSIPIGAIVVAKFYGKRKITFPLMCVGVGINALITTSITYLF
jgi:hypothetical protein